LDEKNRSKALLICFIFILLITLQPTQLQGKGHDYFFHLTKAQGEEYYTNEYGEIKNTESYPPLFHWLASPFSFRENTFYFFTLCLIGIAIPMSLFFTTGRWETVAFYFTTSSIFYFFEIGYYGQAMAFLVVSAMFFVKNNFVRMLLVLAALLSHSMGLFFALTVFGALLLKESGLLSKVGAFLACSGWFPVNRPDEVLGTEIVRGASDFMSLKLNLGRLVKLGVEIFPLPFMFMALRGFLHRKELHFVLIALTAFAFGTQNFRGFYVIPLVGVIGLTYYYQDFVEKTRLKKWFWLTVAVYGLIQFAVWWRYKSYCFPLI